MPPCKVTPLKVVVREVKLKHCNDPRASWVLVVLQFSFKVDFSTGALQSAKENMPSTLAMMVYLAYFASGGPSYVNNLKT